METGHKCSGIARISVNRCPRTSVQVFAFGSSSHSAHNFGHRVSQASTLPRATVASFRLREGSHLSAVSPTADSRTPSGATAYAAQCQVAQIDLSPRDLELAAAEPSWLSVALEEIDRERGRLRPVICSRGRVTRCHAGFGVTGRARRTKRALGTVTDEADRDS